MPAIKPGSLVLVSGASGFIATHLCSTLLTRGYKVRGTVRSKDKGEYLVNLFKGVGQFEYVIVEDIAQPGSFDEAVKGVDGIAHTASPFYIDAATPEELIEPAVEGTQGIMKSALKNNPNLQRMVITSSVAAVMSPSPSGPNHSAGPPYTFTESDWNEHSHAVVEKEGNSAPGGDKYRASKTLAERSAWDLMEKEKPKWDLATINPPLVFGPIIHQVESPEKINTSIANFWAYCTGKKTDEDLGTSAGNYIDVRDVALAHYLALTTPQAGGERFIISNGPFCGQDIVDILHEFPSPPPNLPVGKPGTGPEIDKAANAFSGEKAEKVLGIKYTPLTVTVADMYKSLKERFG